MFIRQSTLFKYNISFYYEIGGFGGSLYSQTSGAQDMILKILFALTVILCMNIMACVVEMIGLGFIVAKPAIISIDV